ncbi:neuronal acetylcholine receptor subunit alpha-10 [Aplysia californica]|uniref:Neuronal acetylcholine receptor subunit alpha-10 n=1 Tax=Aplysia californica TaxID=6500 RepID=A0ABM0JC61_APLCA|nr:neuronal acetylcholine receptor subunit alpha-10 [Aplysia californica]
MAWFSLLCFMLAFAGAEASRYKKFYTNFNKEKITDAFPQPRKSAPLDLDVRVTHINVVDMDTANNRVSVILWKRETWHDADLTFNEARLNISGAYVGGTDIWSPDTAFFNVAGPEQVLNREVIAFSQGDLMSVSRVHLSVNCDLKRVKSYSGATCELHLGSFAFGNELIRLREPREGWSFLVDPALNEGSHYEVLSQGVKKSVKKYPAGDPKQFYYDMLTFSFSFREKFGGRAQ